MKSELTLIPRLSIHPDKICTYNEIHWDPFKPSKAKSSMPLEFYLSNTARIIDSSRSAEGKVSDHARRKMVKAIDYLLLMAKPQNQISNPTGRSFQFCIGFITLTLPSKQIHDDNTIKKECLNQILIELKQRHKVKNYLWRAEKQKNGNIHFHIIVDKFVNWNELRNRWNRIINKLGYVDRYQANQKAFHSTGFRFRSELEKDWTYERQLKAYQEGARHDFRNPNSTDVHGIKKINNLKNYVTKYMTKNEDEKNLTDDTQAQYGKQTGRIWGCNQELSDLKGAQLIVDNEISTALKKIIDKVQPVKYEGEYFTVFYIDQKQLQEFSPDILFVEFSRYLMAKFNYSNQLIL